MNGQNDGDGAEAPSPPDWHVETRGLVKRYGGAQALRGVDVRIRRGTVHALVGENGAGKSTLGRVIAGATGADGGELLVDGAPVHFRTPREALRERIALIAQELALVPRLTVVENVFLGVEPGPAGFLLPREQRRRFHELNTRTGFGIEPDARVDSLRVADQQKVEILRALARDAHLIIMDEPTAALPAADHEHLFEIIRQLGDDGVTVVYVSHFLKEVLALADELTVLRNGEVVLRSSAAEQTPESLVAAMIGHALPSSEAAAAPSAGEAAVVLSVRGLARAGAFADISFDVRSGEILGLAGLVGSGRSEVVRAIFGADRLDAGTVTLEGREVTIRSPRAAVRAGIAMLPESRKDQGLLMRRPIRENVSLPHLDSISRGPFVDRGRERRAVADVAAKVDLRATGLGTPVRGLSGGNQQKALFAKWLLGRPKVLIVDEPTRGVDVGAKEAIHGLIGQLAAEGAAVIVVSSEFEEIARLAHRVLVMRAGRIVAEMEAEDATEARLIRAAFGATEARV